MIKIDVKNFKYGSFIDSTIYEFDNDQEVNDFISALKGDTEHISDMENQCGESCGKWTCEFEYKGVKYNLNQDC